MLTRRSKVSTRFVLTISVIYSIIIILIVFSFLYILKINSNILREILLSNNDAYLIKKAGLIIDRLKENDIQNRGELSEELKKYCSKDNEFLYILIFSKTHDENYFKVQKKIPFSPTLKISAKKNELVQEKKQINYLKAGIFRPIIDPVIYAAGNQYYKCVYHPIGIRDKNYVVEFILSSSEVITALNDYSDKINNIKKYSIIITAGGVIIVVITTLLFIYNFSLLIKNLSGHLKKAAEGKVEFGPNTDKDDDLNDLAVSFSSIISDLKQKKDLAGNLFKKGVGFLKEENLDDAVAVFKTLTIISPDAFGSYFNLGVAYAKKKQYNISLGMFEKALTLNPGYELTLGYIEKVKKRLQDPLRLNGEISRETER